MSAFATAAAGPLRADPSKRVNYTLGLVLGVDEFQQDQLYHAAGRRWHNRLLHGYGTVWGLRVTTPAPGEADPEIRVTDGVAVDPCGREVCVPDTMCVRLNAWLDRHRAVLQRLYGAGPVTLPLAVVLCHRECPDDVVPVPGEPCRSQEDAMQPSRIRDSFELRLALRDEAPWDSPPGDDPGGLALFRFSQPEEEAVRAFGRLLDRVRVQCRGGAPPGGREALLAAVRALAEQAGWIEAGSPPETGDWILLDEGEADAAVRDAIRVWATEVRPRVRRREPVGETCGCACGDPDECCVLLAEVDLPVNDQWRVAGDPFPALEERRPVLLHTRLLQEWLAHGDCCCCAEVDTFATAAPIATDTVRVWLHHAAPLSLPAEAVSVVVNGGATVAPGSVVPVGGMDNAFDVVLSPGAADGDTVELRFDLAQVTEADSLPAPVGGECPTGGLLDRHGPEVRAFVVFREGSVVLPPLAGDAAGPVGSTRVERIQTRPVAGTAPAAGQVLTWDGAQWEPANVPAAALPPGSGDVSGTYPALTVVGLQARSVANTVPTIGQVLTWSGTQWGPAAVPAAVVPPAGGDATGAIGGLTVIRLQTRPVSNAVPATNNVLTWNGTQWIPAAPTATIPPAAGDLAGVWPNVAIRTLQGVGLDAPSPQPVQFLFFDADQGRWRPHFAVESPGGIYRIVAAGHFDRDGNPLSPVYDNTRLQVQPRQPVLNILVGFDSYERRDDVTYVVKGTLADSQTLASRNLVFQRLEANGVLLGANLSGLERFDRIMLEINRIG
ncbi:MAG: hypothetical protein ABW277_15100 [Longimicrobiaceae bacterium]